MSPDRPSSAALQRVIDKTQTRRMITAALDGSELNIRPLKNELVITNPLAPEKGQIRVEYATGHVTWMRQVWEHWGPLEGFHAEDTDHEEQVSPDKILKTLCNGKA
jgi:hypothetical protein